MSFLQRDLPSQLLFPTAHLIQAVSLCSLTASHTSVECTPFMYAYLICVPQAGNFLRIVHCCVHCCFPELSTALTHSMLPPSSSGFCLSPPPGPLSSPLLCLQVYYRWNQSWKHQNTCQSSWWGWLPGSSHRGVSGQTQPDPCPQLLPCFVPSGVGVGLAGILELLKFCCQNRKLLRSCDRVSLWMGVSKGVWAITKQMGTQFCIEDLEHQPGIRQLSNRVPDLPFFPKWPCTGDIFSLNLRLLKGM